MSQSKVPNSTAILMPEFASDNRADLVWRLDALTVNEFCKSVGIGRTSFYAEIKAGRLIALKVGRRTIIPHVEAQRWLISLPTIKNKRSFLTSATENADAGADGGSK
jgi:excisionase family DNA binding protein